jgi:hypothetical protein
MLWVVKGLVAACVFAFTLWAATNLLLTARTEFSAAVVSLLVTVGVLMVVGAAVREVHAWRRPIARLVQRMAATDAGEWPIEGREMLTPALRPLANGITALLKQKRLL